MPTSSLRERLSAALLDFAWDEWAQMGVLATPRRQSPWSQDPEALLLLTLEVARDDPRLFDEVLDWLVRNGPLVSARRLRALCDGPEDTRLASATLDWVARQRRPPAAARPGRRAARGGQEAARGAPAAPPGDEPRDGEPLFHALAHVPAEPDASFLAHGLLRPAAEPSRKSQPPDLAAPIAFAFRLRQLLGVSARAEAVRFLLTAGVPRATVAAVAASAGYAKRNVQEALASLHAGGAVTLVVVGGEQRFGIDRGAWARVLGIDPSDLPQHRDWPQLLGALRRVLRWLRRPELGETSDYLRASQARDLLDEIAPALAQAGVFGPPWRGIEHTWDHLVGTIDAALQTLAPPADADPSGFEVYRDATGGRRWRLKGSNGRVVAASTESFASSANARAAVERLSSSAGRHSFVIEADDAGNFRWRLTAANGRTIATSGESFATRDAAERAARAASDLASAARA